MEHMGAFLAEFLRSALRHWRIPAQMALAVASITAISALPKPGQPVTLIPINAAGVAALPALVSKADTRLIARGIVAGSYVVKTTNPLSSHPLYENGVLRLSAVVTGCGSTINRETAQ